MPPMDASPNEAVIVALDPGTDKCGLAVLTLDARVVAKVVVSPDRVPAAIAEALGARDAEALVIGDRTAKSDLLRLIDESVIRRFRRGVVEVDEHLSSLEGRGRYLDDHRPRGIARFIPKGLRTPSEPYDDYAAVVLGERYLRARSKRA